jgi:hypothetical protein
VLQLAFFLPNVWTAFTVDAILSSRNLPVFGCLIGSEKSEFSN